MKENYFEEYNRIASKIKVLRTAKHLTQVRFKYKLYQ